MNNLDHKSERLHLLGSHVAHQECQGWKEYTPRSWKSKFCGFVELCFNIYISIYLLKILQWMCNERLITVWWCMKTNLTTTSWFPPAFERLLSDPVGKKARPIGRTSLMSLHSEFTSLISCHWIIYMYTWLKQCTYIYIIKHMYIYICVKNIYIYIYIKYLEVK